MNIIDNLLIITLHVLCFIAGMKIANRYNEKAKTEQKEALERQFIRLQAGIDAHSPIQPYGLHPVTKPVPVQPTGDYDGDGPLGESFMNQLKQNGVAKTSFRKSDIAK